MKQKSLAEQQLALINQELQKAVQQKNKNTLRKRYLYAEFEKEDRDIEYQFKGLHLMDDSCGSIDTNYRCVFLGSVDVSENDFQSSKDCELINKINHAINNLNKSYKVLIAEQAIGEDGYRPAKKN